MNAARAIGADALVHSSHFIIACNLTSFDLSQPGANLHTFI